MNECVCVCVMWSRMFVGSPTNRRTSKMPHDKHLRSDPAELMRIKRMYGCEIVQMPVVYRNMRHCRNRLQRIHNGNSRRKLFDRVPIGRPMGACAFTLAKYTTTWKTLCIYLCEFEFARLNWAQKFRRNRECDRTDTKHTKYQIKVKSLNRRHSKGVWRRKPCAQRKSVAELKSVDGIFRAIAFVSFAHFESVINSMRRKIQDLLNSHATKWTAEWQNCLRNACDKLRNRQHFVAVELMYGPIGSWVMTQLIALKYGNQCSYFVRS